MTPRTSEVGRTRFVRSRVGFAVTALASAALVLTCLAGPANASTSHPKTLSKSAPTAAHTYLDPVAATPDTAAFGEPWAVYERHDAVGQALDPTGQLLAVTAGHKPRVFGEVTSVMSGFSIAGRTLTARSNRNAARVFWWQPAKHTSAGTYHAGTVHAGNRYLGSAPDGWIEIDPTGALHDVPVGAGTPRTLGNPFGSAQGVSGVSGPTGIVVWNASDIAFVSFATGHVTTLDTSKLTDLSGGTNTPVCWSASASTVACGTYYFTGEDNSGIRNVFLDPLDGKPAFAETTKCPAEATVLGKHAAWIACSRHLVVLGKSGVVTSPVKIGAWPVAGLGGYLSTNAKRHVGIKVAANVRTSKTVVPSTHATTHATEFALGAGHIIWLQNASSGATVHRRAVGHNAAGTSVNAGTTHRVATSRAVHGQLASAGKTYAYPTKLTSSFVGHHGSETLRVVSPSGSVSIHDVDRYLPVTVSGHRIAYYTDPRNARVYDLHTHKTTKFETTGIALSGHWLAYADTAGTISLTNLTTGAVRTVASGMQLVDDGLFVHGQTVGWNAYPPGFGGHRAYYRNMAAPGPVVPLSTRVNIWQFSDAGMVLERTPSAASSTTPNFPGARALRFRPNMTFLLQAYGSSVAHTLLVTSYPIAGPQLADGVVAWIDQHGRLKAAAVH
jgi:hypothetical protein